MIKKVKDIIYRQLETIDVLEDVKSHVISETVYTPIDFENDYNAKFGTAFGLMPTLAQSNYYRPPNVSRLQRFIFCRVHILVPEYLLY